jgi:hypothetical protein
MPGLDLSRPEMMTKIFLGVVILAERHGGKKKEEDVKFVMKVSPLVKISRKSSAGVSQSRENNGTAYNGHTG